MSKYNNDNENCVTCRECLYYKTCASPFKYDDNTSVYFCDDFINKNRSDIKIKVQAQVRIK